MAALMFWVLAALVQEPRIPVPSDDAQSKAEKEIRSIFKEEYAVKTSPGQQKLARKLLDQARETKDDETLRYVLFREAVDLSIRAGDLDLLLRSLDELSKVYQVTLSTREAYLSKAEASIVKPEDLKRLAEAHFKLVGEAIAQDQFDVATKSAQTSVVAAKRAKDVTLATRADALLKSIGEIKAAFEKANVAEQTLLATPDDPAANFAWGEYLCLTKGQWEKGLPFLSKGTDAAVRELSTKELAAPSELARQLDVADGWWDLAEKERNPFRKSQILAHARILYHRVLPRTSGLLQLKISKRMGDSKPAPGPTKVNREGLIAWWAFEEGKGTVTANSLGAENKGTLLNGVEWAKGHQGMGLKFNGTNSYVECKDPKLPALNSPQTISWWQYHSSVLKGTETFICFMNPPQTAATQVGSWAGKLTVWVWGRKVLAEGPVFTLDVWHHGAYIFDGRRSVLYMDGKLESSSEAIPQAAPVTKFEFGRWGGVGGPAEQCSGILDDVRIYNRALTEAEIQGLAQGSE